MKKNKRVYAGIWMSALIILGMAGCRSVTIEEQRVTATAYAKASMVQAQESAETGAMAFCNIDFEDGIAAYKETLCDVTTTLGCSYYSTEIEKNWDTLIDMYDTDLLECEMVSSELLEESVQFGFPVQIWYIRLIGTTGWEQNQTNRNYWVQVANESGEWKLNRMLSLTEVEYYRERFQDDTEIQ